MAITQLPLSSPPTHSSSAFSSATPPKLSGPQTTTEHQPITPPHTGPPHPPSKTDYTPDSPFDEYIPHVSCTLHDARVLSAADRRGRSAGQGQVYPSPRDACTLSALCGLSRGRGAALCLHWGCSFGRLGRCDEEEEEEEEDEEEEEEEDEEHAPCDCVMREMTRDPRAGSPGSAVCRSGYCSFCEGERHRLVPASSPLGVSVATQKRGVGRGWESVARAMDLHDSMARYKASFAAMEVLWNEELAASARSVRYEQHASLRPQERGAVVMAKAAQSDDAGEGGEGNGVQSPSLRKRKRAEEDECSWNCECLLVADEGYRSTGDVSELESETVET